MRRAVAIYAFAYDVGVSAVKRGIFFERIGINVYLPADTAAMTAFIRYTAKAEII
jgi:hypothetical protein